MAMDFQSLPPEFLKGLLDRMKTEEGAMPGGSDPLNTGFKVPGPGQMSQNILGMDVSKPLSK